MPSLCMFLQASGCSLWKPYIPLFTLILYFFVCLIYPCLFILGEIDERKPSSQKTSQVQGLHRLPKLQQRKKQQIKQPRRQGCYFLQNLVKIMQFSSQWYKSMIKKYKSMIKKYKSMIKKQKSMSKKYKSMIKKQKSMTTQMFVL